MNTTTKILMTASLAFVLSGAVNAQTNAKAGDSKPANETTNSVTRQFVDTNKNGICDNFEAGGQKKGASFVDKNGDGVCDNRGVTGKGQGRGNGCGQGYRHRQGQGNGNGNCCGRGQGCGYGKRQGR